MTSSIFSSPARCGVLASLVFTCSSPAEHFRVYLLGGQSNGNGRGDAAELSVLPLSAEGVAAPQTDVGFYWRRTQDTENGNLTQNTWLDLQPDSGHGVNSPAGHEVEFGPELTFGRTMADNDPSVNIAIIKYTHGGTNLHTQWSATGFQYLTFLSTVEDGLAALTSNGDTFEPGGMIWVQGEADAGTAVNAGNYEANLLDLITRVRNDVFGGEIPGGYTFPFVISGLSNNQYTNFTGNPLTVRQAQERVAASGRQTAFVNTDGLSTYPNSGRIHFDATAQIAIGRSCAAQMLTLEANDFDRDGLLLVEENSAGTDPLDGDSDGDGQSDGLEVVAGTNALDASSFFQVCEIALSNDEISLTWPSRPGNFYEVEASLDLLTWMSVAEAVPASATGAQTTLTQSLTDLFEEEVVEAEVLASYDAQTGSNGVAVTTFDNVAFDSVDTASDSISSRIVQGGSLTGGGADVLVLNRNAADGVFFEGISRSGAPGFNFGGVNGANQAAAASNGDYFAFTSTSSEPVSYSSLSFFANQFGTTTQVDVSYRIGTSSEVFIIQGFTPTGNNGPVIEEIIDFPNFTTNEDVTWTFYLYGAAAANQGVRFDDIVLSGSVSEESEGADLESLFFTVRIR